MNQNIISQNSSNFLQEASQLSEKRYSNTSQPESKDTLNSSVKEKQFSQGETVNSPKKNTDHSQSQQPITKSKQTNDIFAKELKDLTSKDISAGFRKPSNSSMFWYMLLSKWERDRQKRRKS